MRVDVTPIGFIKSCFTEKFGIPRQPGMVKSSQATLELFPPFNREEMVRGLEEFSHLWVQFIFHETLAEGWKPTVRPPWLGGKKRVGVFACRSPHRPNHIGLSVVKLEKVTCDKKGCRLELSGIDFLDKTPVIDIKPYVPYSDCVLTATGGYATGEVPSVSVIFSSQAMDFCAHYETETGRKIKGLIEEMIGQDPRPAIQKSGKSAFGMLLWDVNIRWSVTKEQFRVETCEKI
jgi:tRNA-Thr(GGU) m(6)t(6)A37 methyltransferase TsaA